MAKVLTAAIYCRTSSDTKGEGAGEKSIPDQLKECRQLCRREGYKIVGEYLEPGVTGRAWPTGFESRAAGDSRTEQHVQESTSPKKRREGLGRLFKKLEGTDIVIVRDVDRLYRPKGLCELLTWLPIHLADNNVCVHSCRDGLMDYNRFETSLMLLISGMSKNQMVSSQTKHSIEKRAALKNDGIYHHTPPFGYKQDKRQKHKYDLWADQVETVKLIFKRYLSGKSIDSIARYLNKHNHRTSTSYTPKKAKHAHNNWTPSSVRLVVRRPVYAGLLFNTSKVLIKCVNLKPIISQAQYHKAQEIIEARAIQVHGRKGNRNNIQRHPLSGIIKCGFCQNSMMVKWCKTTKNNTPIDYIRYECKSQKHAPVTPDNIGCKRNAINETQLEAFLMEFLPWSCYQMEQEASDIPDIPTLMTELETWEAKENRLIASFGDIDDDLFKKTANTITERIQHLRKEIIYAQSMLSKKDIVRVPVTPDMFFRSVVSSVTVFKFCFDLNFLNGDTVTRLNSFDIPVTESIEDANGLTLKLRYKSGDELKTIYQTDGLMIQTIGHNPKPAEKWSEYIRSQWA